jgi:hypothetical protein
MISTIGLNKLVLMMALCDGQMKPMIYFPNGASAEDELMHCVPEDMRHMIMDTDELDATKFDALMGRKGAAVELVAKMRVENARILDKRFLAALEWLDAVVNDISALQWEANVDPTKSSLTYLYYLRTDGAFRKHDKGCYSDPDLKKGIRETIHVPELAAAFYVPKTAEELERIKVSPVFDDAGNFAFP